MDEDFINEDFMRNNCMKEDFMNDNYMNNNYMKNDFMNDNGMNEHFMNKVSINENINTSKKEVSRYITDVTKKKILEKQLYKCANSPFIPAIGLVGYKCLLYKCGDGSFDEAGYTFDHIEEFCLTKNNNITNIQALCPNCHSVKTKNFSKYKYTFTSIELEQGAGFMET